MKHIYDDGGRSRYFKGKAGDCVCRSIAIVTGRDYREIYERLADGQYNQRATKRTGKQSRSARDGIHTKRKWFNDYMKELGFTWVSTMGIGTGCKVHMRDDELPRGRIIAVLSRHYAAVIDGVLHDTHDCSRDGTRCVYGYWRYDK